MVADLAQRGGSGEHRAFALERAYRCEPRSDRAQALAEVLEGRGEWARAADVWAHAEDATLSLGRCALRAGRLEQSAAALDDLLRRIPGHPEATRLRGHVAAERGAWATARAMLGSLDDAASLADLSRVHRLAGDWDAAVATAKDSIEHTPTAAAYGRLAEAHLEASNSAEALDAADNAIRLAPDEPRVHMLAMRCALVAGDPARALSVVRDDAPHAGIQSMRTLALAADGRTDEAEALRGLDRFLRTRTLGIDVDALATALDDVVWNEAPASHATVDGAHSADLARGAAEPIDAVLDAIGEAVVSHARDLPKRRHAWLAARPTVTALHAWSVRLRGPGHQTPHVHPDGWMSGVLYLRVPSADAPAGALRFAGPDAQLAALASVTTRTLMPAPGRLVLFPSHLWHETVPTAVHDERLSLAFDVLPQR